MRLLLGNSALNRLIIDSEMRWCTTWFDKPDEGEAEDAKCKGADKKTLPDMTSAGFVVVPTAHLTGEARSSHWECYRLGIIIFSSSCLLVFSSSYYIK